MNILINAISVKEGGSLVVLHNLVNEMSDIKPDWQWHVITNAKAYDFLTNKNNIIYHIFSEDDIKGWKIRIWYETVLIKLLKKIKSDILFSLTNYLPYRKLPCPSLLLVQHAGHFSELFKALTEKELASTPARMNWRLKGLWVKSSIRKAQVVTVQTETLAHNIMKEMGVPEKKIMIISHGTGLVKSENKLPSAPKKGNALRIGYITKNGVQKNFEVLFSAIAKLPSLGIKPTLVLTLSENVPENERVFNLIEKYGISEYIDNHGEISSDKIISLYSSLNIFVFPSLCESFGLPMLEAMAKGLPLVVSETKSNIEIVGKYGLTFPSYDSSRLATLIKDLSEDTDLYNSYTKKSQQRALHFTWNKAGMKTLKLIEKIHSTH